MLRCVSAVLHTPAQLASSLLPSIKYKKFSVFFFFPSLVFPPSLFVCVCVSDSKLIQRESRTTRSIFFFFFSVRLFFFFLRSVLSLVNNDVIKCQLKRGISINPNTRPAHTRKTERNEFYTSISTRNSANRTFFFYFYFFRQNKRKKKKIGELFKRRRK